MLTILLLQACGKEGCLTGTDPQCVVPSPCADLSFTCSADPPRAYVLKSGDPLPLVGPDVLAAPGDLVLESDDVVAVLDGVDHPHYVAPTGGSLLDLALKAPGGDDSLRNVFQATGLLPGDAVHYTNVRVLDEDGVAAVQFTGVLDGHPDIFAATRYELRACEHGVRIRTEIVNREPDPYPLFLVDAFYWGGREHLPFTPGDGFEHPTFGLTTIPDALRDVQWMSAGGHDDAASYGVTGCQSPTISGFQSADLSAIGPPKRVLMPRDYQVYERFVAVGEGPSVSGAADVLADVREKLRGERSVTLSGSIDGASRNAAVATIQVKGKDGWVTSVVPQGGTFHAKVPPNAAYTLVVESFGKDVASFPADVKGDDFDVGHLDVPAPGVVDLTATVDGVPDHLLVFVHPSEEADEDALSGALYGQWDTCAPLLGNPYGPSPACNRVLVGPGSPTFVSVPPGTYDFYAVGGPFTSMAHVDGVVVGAGSEVAVQLDVVTLPIQPAGTLSGDFHVHGRASFDSALPDDDRIRALLAARVQVIASTDHDVVNDYADAVATLGAADRMKLLTGTETTGHILFPLVETTIYPKVIGHFIFWPLQYDPEGPWRGAPWDELAEPGELFDRVKDAGLPSTGVIQLNHPWGGIQFGRDFAWPTAIGLDLNQPLPTKYDGTGQGLFLRTPPGARTSNAAYDAEEVMNGSNNANFLQYRAIWHYLLNHGVVRAGTANSDSHSLTDNVLGTPRNVVWTDATLADFDEPTFDASVKAGTILGTNGPIVEVSLADASGAVRTPSVTPFAPDLGGSLKIDVTAAPWVPVEEVRILVNGKLVKTLTPTTVSPPDPFGTDGFDRLSTTVPLSDLVPDHRDSWIVVEAGAPLAKEADLDCNGVPDTGDLNGDGTIDWRDVEDLTENPGPGCLDTVGVLADPPRPPWNTPGFFFERVTPGGYPMAFTNPLILDLDGDGAFQGVFRVIPAAMCLVAGSAGSGMAEGPVRAALWDGGLGSAQSLCPRTEVGLEGRGYLLVDTPHFYGELVGSRYLEGRVAIDDRTAVGLTMEAVRYQDLISAIGSSYLGYGHTSISAVRVLSDPGDGPRLGLAGRLVLPTAIGLYGHSWPIAVDLGVAGQTGGDRWDLHGQVGLAGSVALSKGASQPRLGIPVTAGAEWRPGRSFGLVGDLQASFGYTAPLDHLAIAPGFRFAAGPRWGLELGGTVPLAGRERALTAAELSTSFRL